MTGPPDPFPFLRGTPLDQVQLLEFCLQYRRMPDGSPLYGHAPDPPPPFPGELAHHYWNAAIAVQRVPPLTFEGDSEP